MGIVFLFSLGPRSWSSGESFLHLWFRILVRKSPHDYCFKFVLEKLVLNRC